MICLCATTRRAARLLTRVYEEQLRESNLTPAQFELLAHLQVRPGLSQVDLADLLALDQTTLSRNLRVMVARKWVKRATPTTATTDRRRASYELTTAGHDHWKSALPQWQRAHDHMKQSLGGDWEKAVSLIKQVGLLAAQAA